MLKVRHRIGLLTAAGVLGLGLMMGGPAGAADFGEGLVGWWRFDEGSGTEVSDSSGLGNHGDLVGDAAFTTDGVQGTGVSFGADGVVLIPHHASLEPVTGTVEVWVKVAELRDAAIVVKVSNYPSIDNRGPCGCAVILLNIGANGSASAHVLVYADQLFLGGAPWASAFSPPNLITPGKWHHLAMRWDGNTVAVFVDGVRRAENSYTTVPGTGLLYSGETPLQLAAPAVLDVGVVKFVGQLDDARFYARGRRDVEIFTDYVTKGKKPAKP